MIMGSHALRAADAAARRLPQITFVYAKTEILVGRGVPA